MIKLISYIIAFTLMFPNTSELISVDSAQTIPGDLQMYATIESIGIAIPFTGDNNQNNSASVEYREHGSSQWSPGPEMIVDRESNEWRVSLVHLLPETRYETRILFDDPDGVAPVMVQGEMSTRPDYPQIGSTGVIRFVPDDGTFQTVIDASNPGDTIRLRSGTYFESIVINDDNSGQPGAYITIEPEPGGNVIMDGSDTDLNNPNANNWKHHSANIYYSDVVWGNSSCDENSLPGYVGEERDGKSVRYLLYKGPGEWSGFLNAPLGSAYYDCTGRLYIRNYAGNDPDNSVILASKRSSAIELEGGDYIRIRGIRFQYYGTYGIFLTSPGADNNIIEDNEFNGIGFYHIRLGYSPNHLSSNNLIQNNYFSENGYRDSGWTIEQQYDFAQSVGVRLLESGPGNVVRRNIFSGGTDGISVVTNSHHTDVYENTISDCMDDGIEIDSAPGQNIRVWGNRIRDCYSGISNQDWFRNENLNSGPVYIFRNVITGGNDPDGRTDMDGKIYSSAYAFKVGSDDDYLHHVYYYHNTIVMPDSDSNGNGIQDSGGKYFSGLTARNNIWSVTQWVFKLRAEETTRQHDLNCDSLYSNRYGSGGELIQWSDTGGPGGDGLYDGIEQFQSFTSQELSGMTGGGTRFYFDYSLKSGSPEIDQGCMISGFNDKGTWKFHGLGPDIGAFEFESDLLLHYLPVARR